MGNCFNCSNKYDVDDSVSDIDTFRAGLDSYVRKSGTSQTWNSMSHSGGLSSDETGPESSFEQLNDHGFYNNDTASISSCPTGEQPSRQKAFPVNRDLYRQALANRLKNQTQPSSKSMYFNHEDPLRIGSLAAGLRTVQSQHMLAQWNLAGSLECLVRKAKNDMKTITVRDGKLFIDYEFIADVPEGIKITY